MRNALALLLFAGSAWACCPSASAQSAVPEGNWVVSHKVAIEVFDCSSLLCGRIVWLRNPALRTAEMCGKTIALFGRTEILNRIPPRSLGGWC
jgi:hypothetical protein